MWTQKKQFVYANDHPPKDNILGEKQFTQGINCYTEFDPLQLVIIGNIDNTTRMLASIIEYGDSDMINTNFGVSQNNPIDRKQAEQKANILPEQIVKTTQMQAQNIVNELRKRGIKVIRTGYVDHSKQFQSYGVVMTGFNNFNARDLTFAYDDTLYEFPSIARCRKNQIRGYQWIEEKLVRNGSKIFYAPKIQLNSIQFLKSGFQNSQKGCEVYADAANLIKLGLDILFQISFSGSQKCYQVFRQLMQQRYSGKVRVHPIVKLYDGVHIDTTISVIGFNKKLEKFIVLVNGIYAKPSNMPAIFRGQNWRVIEVNSVIDQNPGYEEHFFASDKIALNFLPLNSELVLMNSKQIRMHQIFEFYGIEVLKMPHFYGRHVAGGFHCMSNDLKRKDQYGFRETLPKLTEQLSKKQKAGLFDVQLLQFLQSKGDLQVWVDICNENRIYPHYLTDHMSIEEKLEMQKKHKIQTNYQLKQFSKL